MDLAGVRPGLWLALGLGVLGGLICPTPFCSQNFIKAKQYPKNTQVEVQNDGAESPVFQQLFQKWTVPNRTSGLGKTHTVGSVGEGKIVAGPEAGPVEELPVFHPPFLMGALPGLGTLPKGQTPGDMDKLKSITEGAKNDLPFICNSVGPPQEANNFCTYLPRPSSELGPRERMMGKHSHHPSRVVHA